MFWRYSVARDSKRDKDRKINQLLDRQQPYDKQAEQGVLGSIILMPSLMDELSVVLHKDDFHDPAHQVLFSHFVAIHNSNRPLDAAILVDTLKSAGDLEAAGGLIYLSEVINAVPNAAHARHYADIVKEKYRLRQIIYHCTAALAEAYDEMPSIDITASLEAKLSVIESPLLSDPITIAEAASQVLDSIHNPADVTNKAMSGILTLDTAMGPIMAGETAVVAARTSMGKTSFVQQMMLHAAEMGRTALLVSLEMSDRELGTRELCRITGIDSRRIRNNELSHQNITELMHAQTQLVGLPFYLWSPPRATCSEIKSVAKKVRAKYGLSVLAVDLIGLVAPDREQAKYRREEQIRAISASFKAMAKELHVPVIILAQLNREADGEEPRLAHLRDSGRIEEDATTVLLLHANKTEPPINADTFTRFVIIAKHRNGQVGQVKVSWHPLTTSFGDHPDQVQEFN
jgi:replicative DNA helicase